MKEEPGNQNQILAECAEGYISVCLCCKEFNFVFKNILVTFPEKEMHQFFNWLLAERREPELSLTLVNGRDHFFRGPVSNLFFVYKDDELDEIEKMYLEATLVLDARRIVSA